MIQTLISKTTLEIKIDGDNEKVPFKTKTGSPQGNNLSGTAFDCYFEDALVDVREEIKERKDGKQDHTCCSPSNLRDEAVPAGDPDFISNSKQHSIKKSK